MKIDHLCSEHFQTQGLENECLALEAQEIENRDRLATLEINGSLLDSEVIADIGRSQILAALLPKRIAAKRDKLAFALMALLESCHSFIFEELGPRIRNLEKEARAAVEKELSKHITDPNLLQRSVDSSQALMKVNGFLHRATIYSQPHKGVLAYAEDLMVIHHELQQPSEKEESAQPASAS